MSISIKRKEKKEPNTDLGDDKSLSKMKISLEEINSRFRQEEESVYLKKGQIKVYSPGNSLVVQWLGLHALTAEGLGSIPGQGTKILQAAQHNQKKKKKKVYTPKNRKKKELRKMKSN